ncbi:MAG: metallophosphoesterase [Ruminococcus sp.]|nr:metallophosphoesterase [Ruminococcus sp.]
MYEQETYNDFPVEDFCHERHSSGRRKKRKKKKLRWFMFFLALIIFIWWFNNFTITTPEFTVRSDKITQSFRIAVISDLHADRPTVSNEKIVSKIQQTDPDLVFMLGDMYSRDSEWDEMEIPIELVSMLRDKNFPVYFVPGEHDTSERYIAEMENAGAHVMSYKGEIINLKGNNIQIIGIDNVYFSPTFDLNNAFSLAQGCFTILMAHIPNYESYASFGADLTICGDSHGGIIQLPFDMGPAYYGQTGEWFPELTGYRADIYDKGLFPYDGGTMFITSGIGAYPIPARFNNRPEIAVIDIEPA